MRQATLTFVAALLLVGLAATSGSQPSEPADEPMLWAARGFLDTLDDEQRGRATFAFDDEERFDWHYVPRARRGLPLKDMNDEQRRAAHGLLQSVLGSAGYLKVTGIMSLESILRELESRPGREATHRDAGLYYFSIFGEPSDTEPWGWRVEGHHLSINACVVEGRATVTPLFLGANPAVVRSGPHAGLEVLRGEQEIAWRLLESLDEDQRRVAVIADRAPRDIIMNPGNDEAPEMLGLPRTSMNRDQANLLAGLVLEHAESLYRKHASPIWQMSRLATLNTRFAWAGGTTRGEPHYYRIQTDEFVLEYDNVQGGSNHIHVVWRDTEHDFGANLLAEHRAREHPSP